MKLKDLTTIEQLDDFLAGTQAVVFAVISDKDTYHRWIQAELIRFRYLSLSRSDKGVLIGYLMKVIELALIIHQASSGILDVWIAKVSFDPFGLALRIAHMRLGRRLELSFCYGRLPLSPGRI